MNVFVYGSLLSGFGNHGVMRASYERSHPKQMRFDRATIMPRSGLTLGKWNRHYGFPFLTHTDPGRWVQGEVYYDVPQLQYLDRLEGYPSFYNRMEVDVIPDEGIRPVSAWVYYIDNESDWEPVPNGDWREFKAA